MAAFWYRFPDLTGKNYVLFRLSTILNINWPYPSLLLFYSEFLAPKSLLSMQSHCSANTWTLTLGYLVHWSQLNPKKERGLQILASEETPGPDTQPLGQAALGPKGRWATGSPEQGQVLHPAVTLLHREDFPRHERIKTTVSSTAWEK